MKSDLLLRILAEKGCADAADGVTTLLDKMGRITPEERKQVVFMGVGAASALEIAGKNKAD
ncbi:MAG: hypothetical protein IJ583_15195 [Firmicutes bacterium]|nr:hypothetical protein [Bacillota bacterium]